ncbi:MAG: isoprenyl transferase [Cytophagales bacterium]|nr:isoprenyl transferase [Cytophagales bacterium]
MKELIDSHTIPLHIAVIMDGNGRWAKSKGEERIFGHVNALKAVTDTVEGCAELGVKYLTLYAFSTENWSRPVAEVNGLMELLVNSLVSEAEKLNNNNIKLNTIGDTESLPLVCQKQLKEVMDYTKNNDRMTLNLALSYSGRWDLTQATKKIANEVAAGKLQPEQVNEKLIDKYLATAGQPDPELLIRTSGEMRISNFLLWQMAYTELYITETLWPDFRKEHLHEAIVAFQKRERRFGKTSEQLTLNGNHA